MLYARRSLSLDVLIVFKGNERVLARRCLCFTEGMVIFQLYTRVRRVEYGGYDVRTVDIQLFMVYHFI